MPLSFVIEMSVLKVNSKQKKIYIESKRPNKVEKQKPHTREKKWLNECFYRKQDMRQAEAKAEPKTEPFEEGDKVATAQQQSTQNQLQSPVATSQANSSFVDTNGNSEGNEILVLVPALNANGLTTANITTEYRENGRNLDRKTNELQTNYTRDNNTRNIVTEQIVWIPKIEAQSQQDGHQATTSAGNTVCQPPPLYSRIKQLNYSQVETNVFSLFNKKTHPKNLSKKIENFPKKN